MFKREASRHQEGTAVISCEQEIVCHGNPCLCVNRSLSGSLVWVYSADKAIPPWVTTITGPRAVNRTMNVAAAVVYWCVVVILFVVVVVAVLVVVSVDVIYGTW